MSVPAGVTFDDRTRRPEIIVDDDAMFATILFLEG
jgi:hypothetical protein